MNRTKSIAIIIGLSVTVLISLLGKKANEKESIIAMDTETSAISQVEVEEEQINWFLDHVTGIDCYTVTQEEIDRIGQMDDLLYLSLLINDDTIDLTPLSNLGHLKSLEMSFFADGLDMTFLNGLSNLQYLYIEGCDSIEDLTFLRHMPALQEVIIKNVADVDLGCFEENRFLKSIHIVGGNIRNMEGLSELKQLRSIWLVENTLDRDERQILNLDITGDLICLEDMRLEYIKVDKLSPLARLDRLSYIYLKDTGIGDIEPLGRVRNLEEVYIYETESEQIEKQASIYLKHVANITVE